MVKLSNYQEDLDGVDSADEYQTTDYGSDAESDYSVADEGLLDRIAALKDIVAPETRYAISSKVASAASFGKAAAKFLGNAAWVISTTALIMLAPLVMELEKETQMVMFEKEQQMRDQSAQQMLGTQGGAAVPGMPGAPVGAKPAASLVPPGF
ncbi:hypothetical protein AMAG_16771 [Allomyces macrogynus ATCC 38327]|uniref:Mitochondrial import receptor subunit Tom22 n=1 Tax=Allomyces macrogynus (strain ATCC 38327) TaxID=578462 RepID=A0A0L0TC01_ALLM3|nr:hypothetical protein AMAG_16771 [Allomyces macrogynus ATCC 38327]|eukprot:KNE72282.1 hypothetical protein AMAG_16771 [Allomyces macrogynus ATCC 38327]